MNSIKVQQNDETLIISKIDNVYKWIQLNGGPITHEIPIVNQKIELNLIDIASDYNKSAKRIDILLVKDRVRTLDIEDLNQPSDMNNDLRIKNRINLKTFEISNNPFFSIYKDEIRITPYINKKGSLALSLLPTFKLNTYFNYKQIDSISFEHDKFYIKGKFSIINSKVNHAYLVTESRNTGLAARRQLNIIKTEKKKNDIYTAHYFDINTIESFYELLKENLPGNDVIDLYIELELNTYADPIKVKIGNPRILAERFMSGTLTINVNEKAYILEPYFTLKGRNISFKIVELSEESSLTYNKILKTKKKTNIKPIWVIGERHYKAQDNGYYFFKYLRENHPEIDAYYIIDFNSPEYTNVKSFGNVINFRSKEHFEIMHKADKIFTTHHPELIFPLSNKEYVNSVKAERIFLQHGVLGTKNLTQINGNQLNDFNVDKFVVSSDREKQIVVRDLKFDEDQVIVSGLSRFDNLFTNTIPKKQILIIPTWRDWLTNESSFLESEYKWRMESLLNHDNLKEIKEKGFKILFCLHPNMQQFTDLIEIPDYITVIRQGEVDVQKLIKESSLMITDYSSVAFDFSFLYKPVIYYQFDKNRFLGKLPSHLDIENELPGKIANEEEEVINLLLNFIALNFKINEKLKSKIDKFIKYRDQKNSQRLFDAVANENISMKEKVKRDIKNDILVQHFYKRYRKNKKAYYSSMKAMNKFLARFHPGDPNIIFFESNVGKGVSDSPKNIYEELKKYNKDLKIVWVTNNVYPFDDEHVITVKRLSFEYFYYISIARYWVNNQNFPYYIQKHRNCEYIQTWHGTPLKKMLNDVEVFEGRDEGYKDRVNTATQKWDYLVSPSSYASTCFRSAFHYKKTMLEIGYPRNDWAYELNDEELIEYQNVIKKKAGIEDNRKIILYAPTFRDDELKQDFVELPFDLEALRPLQYDYIILIKTHMLVGKKLSIPDIYSDFVYNLSNYKDINELYAISDICITDYSSVMFDFANTRKPLLFYTYDLENYRDNLRGFYMDLEQEAPGPLLNNSIDLFNSIKNIEQVENQYKVKYEAFYNKYCEFEEGNAARNIVENIILKEKI
ncbi:CDP-glycerol glycerophosphotransferase family protein [Macrococcus armenti]|uniref:CDP-glycerol glycerophosphotransferase family protein n=1 Tax=Macrococcus armenti TaxID=2875764 RepID=A0ABY3ZWG6_9STAP|nr:CDP-glycerol glycerophosphotransferase family protein [Macrococcus armenti]UOB21208.1 CDP-glycerol glycerophosphotransferase family protein [Macrococcus armenti]